MHTGQVGSKKEALTNCASLQDAYFNSATLRPIIATQGKNCYEYSTPLLLNASPDATDDIVKRLRGYPGMYVRVEHTAKRDPQVFSQAWLDYVGDKYDE